MRLDPAAKAEGLQAALALPAGHLIEVYQAHEMEAERSQSQLRTRWQGWWDLWQNDVVMKGKEDWQSQIWLPKPFAAVEQATAVIRRSLLDSPDFFGVSADGNPELAAAAAGWVKPGIKALARQAEFAEKYIDAAKVGFILGISTYLKYRWSSFRTPQLAGAEVHPETGVITPVFTPRSRSMLSIDTVMPWDIYRDPDTAARENFSGSYLWHTSWLSRAAIRAMAQNGWDPEAVERALNSWQGANAQGLTNTQQRQADRKQYAYERHKFRRDYLVHDGWLDIPDENGDVVYPDAHMIAIGNEVVFGPDDNPLWATDLNTGRRKWPFVAMSPIAHPMRFEGRGLLEQDEGLSWLFVNTFNLLADAMNWVVNPDFEVYEAGLVDWENLTRYPGKMWAKNQAGQVISPANTGGLNINGILAFLNYVESNRENANFVTQFVQGLPGSRADITKGEVQIKTGQSLGIFEAMARNYEHGGRVMVELMYDHMLQYLAGNDWTDPGLVSILGPERAMQAAQWTLSDRVDKLQGQMDFNFTGVSQAFQKAELLQKILQFAALAAGPYAGFTKPWQILRVVAETMGLQDRIDVLEPAPAMPGMAPGMAPSPPGMPPAGPAGAPMPGPPPGPTDPAELRAILSEGTDGLALGPG